MEPTQWFFFIRYLTYFILIGLSHGRALKGQNVRDATSSDNLSFAVHILTVHNSSIELCTGTLITRWSVLTAAHCVVGINETDIGIKIGSTDVRQATNYRVASWKSFDQWYHNTIEERNTIHDIAIITLAERVNDTNIQPASISYTAVENLHCSKVRIAGWGVTDNGKPAMILKTGVVKVIPLLDCIERAKKITGKEDYIIPVDYFCSAADPWLLTSCGDSGAPILNKQNQLVAIHKGLCPNLDEYPQEFQTKNSMGLHLLLLGYENFINDVAVAYNN